MSKQATPSAINTRYGPMQIPDGDSDIIGRFLTRYGEWGWNEVSFIASVLEDGARVLDAGAFVGTFGLGLAQVRALQNLCFVDANPAILPYLAHNAANARCPAIVIEAMLAGQGAQPRAGRSEAGNLGATSFSDADGTAATTPLPLRAMTLAELCAEHGDVDIVKLDVEGMELQVLQADAAHLSRGKVTLWIECNEDTRSLKVAELLLSWHIDVFYFACPAYNPGNFNADPQAVYPFAFEAGLLAAPRITPALSADLRAQGCLLTQVRSVEDVRQALWRTPRWGMAAWEGAVSTPELAALAGRTLRGEVFADFLQPGTVTPPPLWDQLAATAAALATAERELARVAARALDHLSALGAARERAAALDHELALARTTAHSAEAALAITRASTSWRLTAPLRALIRRTGFLNRK
jgi:FkbM family methyltransferase